MPVEGFPTSYEFLKRRSRTSLTGGNESTWEFICSSNDYLACRLIFLRNTDFYDPTLECVEVEEETFVVRDAEHVTYKCVARFIPSWKLAALLPDGPFKIRYQGVSLTHTLKSVAWVWASGQPCLNTNIKPLKPMAACDAVLFGTRTTYDPSVYSAYADTVNSDVFKGMAAGHVLFGKGPSAMPKQLDTGVDAWDVQIPLQIRWAATWNEHFNETTGLYEELRDLNGDPMYTSTAFAELLE